ncbi:U1 small nuclear ribonucleoprotein 70 kDa-like isoform X1 [Struthio camelus]|uniref:U1 small nuclear ribonucleoprotein 70 kDa-like isoform X1 n=1 Tax=Struthio camelus TaxID=8801 RepID=UPI00360414BD
MTVDEKRRRSRRWCRLVSGPSTAVELYTVQKASPCGKTVSASANSQRGGFYGGISTAGRELSVNFQKEEEEDEEEEEEKEEEEEEKRRGEERREEKRKRREEEKTREDKRREEKRREEKRKEEKERGREGKREENRLNFHLWYSRPIEPKSNIGEF